MNYSSSTQLLNKSLDKFSLVLFFAPAIEFILLNEREKLGIYLTDENAIKEKYLNVILDKNSTIIKDFLQKMKLLNHFLLKQEINSPIRWTLVHLFILNFIRMIRCLVGSNLMNPLNL